MAINYNESLARYHYLSLGYGGTDEWDIALALINRIIDGVTPDHPLYEYAMKLRAEVEDGRQRLLIPPSVDDLQGKVIVVGITRCDHNDQVVDQQQLAGEFVHMDDDAVYLRLANGEIFTLPPDISGFKPATPGEYRLRSTGEVVSNPDYIATWTVQLADNAEDQESSTTQDRRFDMTEITGHIYVQADEKGATEIGQKLDARFREVLNVDPQLPIFSGVESYEWKIPGFHIVSFDLPASFSDVGSYGVVRDAIFPGNWESEPSWGNSNKLRYTAQFDGVESGLFDARIRDVRLENCLPYQDPDPDPEDQEI